MPLSGLRSAVMSLRGPASRSLLPAATVAPRALAARGLPPAPAPSAAVPRAHLPMGAAGATLCGSALWATPRHAVHRRPFATPGAGIPFVDPALQPPPVPAPRVVASLAEERLRRERVATTFFKHPVLDLQTKEQVGEIDLATAIFKQEVRVDILQRVVLWQRAKRRVISRPAKTRSMVSGGGKKPWRQKGTGRARHGSIRSPIWKGGGKAHGPVVRSFAFKLQKKVRRLGLRCALAARFREGMFCIIESEKIPDYKTKVMAALKKKWEWPYTLVITGEQIDENFKRSSGNLPQFNVLPSVGANVMDILKHRYLVLTRDAVTFLQRHLLRDHEPGERNTRNRVQD